MKTVGITVILLFSLVIGYAQVELATSISLSSEDNNSYCVSVDVINNGNLPMKIIGQNIRFFYNSKSLTFRKVFFDKSMPETIYDYELRTNKLHLNRASGKQIAFDNDMGFLNYSVTILNESDYSTIEPSQNMAVQTVCFDKKNNHVDLNDIILALDGASDEYSKAFVKIEASPLNDEILFPVTLLNMELQKDIVSLHK